MRVLWVCNRCLPVVAAELKMDAGNKEGWLAGLSERILEEKNEELELFLYLWNIYENKCC